MIHCNTGFVLHYNILLIQPFRVSSMDVSCQAELRNPPVLLYSILYAFTSASILAYSTWCINANILHGIRATFLWPWFFVIAVYLRAIFVFLGAFSLHSCSLTSYCCHQNSPDIVMPPLEVASTLQNHCLPQTTVTEPNFIQWIFSTLSNFKISSNFHLEFERGCQRYISPLAQVQA